MRFLHTPSVLILAAIASCAAAAAPERTTSAEPLPKPRSVRVAAILGKFLVPDEVLTYKTVEDGKLPLTLDVFKPDDWQASDRRPVLVTFHGGGWAAGDPTTQYYMADRLARCGWVGISVKYRLTNKHHPGTTPVDAVRDARSAVRYVRAHANELGIDPNRLVVNGGSAGGHLAATTALCPDVNEVDDDLSISAMPQAMVLFYPVIDTGPKGYGHTLCGDEWKLISPVDRVVPGLPPTLIMHGDHDTTTPYAGAKLFDERMRAAGNDCTLITGSGGHGYFTYKQAPYDAAMAQVDAWLAEHDYPTTPLPRHKYTVRETEVFAHGDSGYHTYRIPAMLLTYKGTLLAFCEGRKTSSGDHGDVDLVLRRSGNGGRTWSKIAVVHEEGDEALVTIGNPCPVEDRDTGIVWLTFCRENRRVFVTRSLDDGATWDKPIEISDRVTQPEWTWVATGPGHGIQLRNGRLLLPSDCKIGGNPETKHSFAIYSDDHGHTWQRGELTTNGMNECQAVERPDGSVLLSMRNYLGKGLRALATSSDGGLTWSAPELNPDLPCPVCEASIIRCADDSIIYSGPAEPKRRALTIRLSRDGGHTWPTSRVLYRGSAAYSDLVRLPGNELGCFYERDGYSTLIFARFDSNWVAADAQPTSSPDKRER